MIATRDQAHAAAAAPPICVDLDGTLIHSDSLYEGLVLLLKRNPFLVFALPFWLLRGKAALKHEIATRAPIDPEALPFNATVLELLAAERGKRPIILCTAAHESYARAVADHLGVFDRVLATRDVNFSADEKVKRLVAEYGEQGFDYLGDHEGDVKVFASARRAIAVNPRPGLRRRLSQVANLERVVDNAPPRGLRAVVRAMRMHQWVKNLLVFLPLVASHRITDLRADLAALAAFVVYGLTASSVYLLNDLIDLKADRAHPRKRHRPLASGGLSIPVAMALMPTLLVVALAGAFRIAPLFGVLIATYYVTTNLYAFWLKRVPILDTLVLAGLYTLRILAGAAAIDVEPSFWLLAFSMFFFFSLALAKRHSELVELADAAALEPPPSPTSPRKSGETSAIPGRGYNPEDLTTIISQGTSAGHAAVLVLALFINSETAKGEYRHPQALWFICPLMVYWITKLWLNSQRRQIKDDPVVWAVKNRVSRAIVFLCLVCLVLAI